jgi:hypothetical protein
LKELAAGLDKILRESLTSSKTMGSHLPSVTVPLSNRPKFQQDGLFSPGSDRLPKKTQVAQSAPLVKTSAQIQKWRDPRIEGYKNSRMDQLPEPSKISFEQVLKKIDVSNPEAESMLETLLNYDIDNGARVFALQKLGNLRMKSFVKHHRLDVLEKAIENYRSGISMPNTSKAYKALFYLNLGKAYLMRKNVGDLDLAINVFFEGLSVSKHNSKYKAELEKCLENAKAKKAKSV